MNIENHFNNAAAYLDMAKEKVNAQDYESALASIGKAYSHTRELLEHVYKLHALKAKVTSSAGKDSGGPQK